MNKVNEILFYVIFRYEFNGIILLIDNDDDADYGDNEDKTAMSAERLRAQA